MTKETNFFPQDRKTKITKKAFPTDEPITEIMDDTRYGSHTRDMTSRQKERARKRRGKKQRVDIYLQVEKPHQCPYATHHVKLQHFTISNTKVVHSISITPVVIQSLLIVCYTLLNISLQFNLNKTEVTPHDIQET